MVYATIFICLLLQAFRMMRMNSNQTSSPKRDRTGLQTIHPELLDKNGNITNEELWAVRFSEDNESRLAPEAGL